jgi:hypothetical protein
MNGRSFRAGWVEWGRSWSPPGCRRECARMARLRGARCQEEKGAKGTPPPRLGVTGSRWPRKNSFAEAGTRGGQAFSSFVRKIHHKNGKGRVPMKRAKTPTFLLELPLRVDWSQERHVRAHLEAARCLYNALLSEATKRLRRMRNDAAWNKARALPRSQKQERAQAFSALRKNYHFSEYELHEYAKDARCSSNAAWRPRA